jgi:hypothetical protein
MIPTYTAKLVFIMPIGESIKPIVISTSLMRPLFLSKPIQA